MFVSVDGEVFDLEVYNRQHGPLVRGPYDGVRVLWEAPEGFDEGVTVQADEPSANLNTMVARWQSGQPMPEFAPMQFGDVSRVKDIAQIRADIASMEELFMRVPADVRARFKNDALLFAEAVGDASQVEDLRQLGLFPPEEAEAPAAEPASPASAAAPKADAGGDKPA